MTHANNPKDPVSLPDALKRAGAGRAADPSPSIRDAAVAIEARVPHLRDVARGAYPDSTPFDVGHAAGQLATLEQFLLIADHGFDALHPVPDPPSTSTPAPVPPRPRNPQFDVDQINPAWRDLWGPYLKPRGGTDGAGTDAVS